MKERILDQLKSQSLEQNAWMRGNRWIYGIQMTSDSDVPQPVKIGIANDVIDRFKGLQTSHPYPLELIAYFPAIRGTETERLIHALLDEFRLSGEWFRPDPVVLAFLHEQRDRFENAVASESVPNRKRRQALTKRAEYERFRTIQSKAWDRYVQTGMIITRLQVVSHSESDAPVEPVAPVEHSLSQIDNEEVILGALKQWYSARQVLCIDADKIAELTGIDKNTLLSKARLHELPHTRIGSRSFRWTAEHLARSISILGLSLSDISLPDSNARA